MHGTARGGSHNGLRVVQVGDAIPATANELLDRILELVVRDKVGHGSALEL